MDQFSYFLHTVQASDSFSQILGYVAMRNLIAQRDIHVYVYTVCLGPVNYYSFIFRFFCLLTPLPHLAEINLYMFGGNGLHYVGWTEFSVVSTPRTITSISPSTVGRSAIAYNSNSLPLSFDIILRGNQFILTVTNAAPLQN